MAALRTQEVAERPLSLPTETTNEMGSGGGGSAAAPAARKKSKKSKNTAFEKTAIPNFLSTLLEARLPAFFYFLDSGSVGSGSSDVHWVLFESRGYQKAMAKIHRPVVAPADRGGRPCAAIRSLRGTSRATAAAFAVLLSICSLYILGSAFALGRRDGRGFRPQVGTAVSFAR